MKQRACGRITVPASDNWATNDAWIDGQYLHKGQIAEMSTWSWCDQAACAGTDPDVWFEIQDSVNRRYLATICAGCPVIVECLQTALANHERGWWGGTTETDRDMIRRGVRAQLMQAAHAA